jgi:hypothetical protein
MGGMQKTGFFPKKYFEVLFFEDSAWLSSHKVYKIGLMSCVLMAQGSETGCVIPKVGRRSISPLN